jgi:endonuclease III
VRAKRGPRDEARRSVRAWPKALPVKRADIEPFFATLRDANPEPATELEYASVFELLAAVVLSAQATDRGVNKATRALFARAPTPARMLALGLPALEEAIRKIGLFRTKAKNLHATCRILVEEHGGQVPKTREALEALPGVGRKTANVVLNNAFGDPTLAVDTPFASPTGPAWRSARRRSRSSCACSSASPKRSSPTRITG